MIYLITGVPGSGKTLFTIAHLIERVKTEQDRPVYYHGIPELSDSLGWQPLDNPEEWNACPEGSIIVVDEAWQHWPQRMAGKIIPQHVEDLAIHRHKGYDLYIITQRPGQVDKFLRTLVGEHWQVERLMGTERAVIFRWPRCVDDPHDGRIKLESDKELQSFPKHVYSLYKSADKHTHKRRLPKKLIFIGLFILLLFALGGFQAYKALSAFTAVADYSGSLDLQQVPGQPVQPGQPLPGQPLPGQPLPGQPLPGQPLPSDLEMWLEYHRPRLAGIPWTAPIYDDLREPVDYPRLNCVSSADDCRCWTQQATYLAAVPSDVCARVVAYGQFDHARSPVRYNSRNIPGNISETFPETSPGNIPGNISGNIPGNISRP